MRAPSSRALVLTAAWLVFAVVCLLPPVYMFARSLGLAGTLANDAYADLFAGARQRLLFWNTLTLGAGVATLATAIGAPLGLMLSRAPSARVRMVRVLLCIPLAIPSYVLALAWILAFAPEGLLEGFVGREFLSRRVYALPSAVFVLGCNLFPLAMLATEAAARRVESHLEEAGLLAVPPSRVLTHVTMPLVAPATAAAALVIFVMALSDFGVPALLQVRVYTTEVFTAFSALYNFERATALAAPLLGAAMVAALLADSLVGRAPVAGQARSGPSALQPAGMGSRARLCAVLIVCAIAVGAPLGALMTEALAGPLPVAALRGSGQAIRNSLLWAAVGATLVVGIACCIAYGRARAAPRFGRAVDLMHVLLFAVPGTVVGVGLIAVWNRPGMVGALYGTAAMVLLAYLARLLPVAALLLAAAIRQVPRSLEDAAAVSGISWLRTMSGVVVPQITPALAATWIITFILAFGELGATILVAPPGEATLPVRMYTLVANAPTNHLAALALLQTAVVMVPVAVFAGARRPTEAAR